MISLYIRGKEFNATSGERFATYNPAAGELLSEVEQASEQDIEAAVDSAQKGFEQWSALSGAERGRILMRAVAILRERNDELAKLKVKDTGKPLQEAIEVDIATGADVIEYYAGLAAALQGQQQELGKEQFFYTRREPLGICAGIGAWSYPMQIAMWKSAPAFLMVFLTLFRAITVSARCYPATLKSQKFHLPVNAQQVRK